MKGRDFSEVFMSKELTVTFFVGGVRVDKLTEELKERIAQRFGEALSSYYSRNLAEYARLKPTGDRKDDENY